MTTSPDRDINKLNIDFKIKVELFLEECRRRRIGIFVTEAWRSKERQQEMIAQGKSKVAQSKHELGLAVDIAFRGSELYPKDHKRWVEVFYVAKMLEIDRGYDMWKRDLCHFQCNGKKITAENRLILDKYLLTPIKQDNIIEEYAQTKNDCVDYAEIGAISDLKNHRFTGTEIDYLQLYLGRNGFKKGQGGSIYDHAYYVCSRWNGKNPDDKTWAFLVDLNSSQFNALITMGYSVVVTRKTLQKMLKDWMDGTLSGIYPEPAEGWHAIRMRIGDIDGDGKPDLFEINNKKGVFAVNKTKYKNRAAHIENGTIKQYGVVFM